MRARALELCIDRLSLSKFKRNVLLHRHEKQVATTAHVYQVSAAAAKKARATTTVERRDARGARALRRLVCRCVEGKKRDTVFI